MRKIYLFMVGCALALTSCQFFATPKAYEAEIKDYVKFELAMLDYAKAEFTEGTQAAQAVSWLFGDKLADLAVMGLVEEINQMEYYFVEKRTDADNFEQVLQAEIASGEQSDYAEEAEKLLKYYNQQIVALSEFERQTEWSDMVEVWTFSEVRSDLDFVFTYDCDSEKFLIEVEEDSVEERLRDMID
jgi:hypothetical protein